MCYYENMFTLSYCLMKKFKKIGNLIGRCRRKDAGFLYEKGCIYLNTRVLKGSVQRFLIGVTFINPKYIKRFT